MKEPATNQYYSTINCKIFLKCSVEEVAIVEVQVNLRPDMFWHSQLVHFLGCISQDQLSQFLLVIFSFADLLQYLKWLECLRRQWPESSAQMMTGSLIRGHNMWHYDMLEYVYIRIQPCHGMHSANTGVNIKYSEPKLFGPDRSTSTMCLLGGK